MWCSCKEQVCSLCAYTECCRDDRHFVTYDTTYATRKERIDINKFYVRGIGKPIPLQPWTGPEGSRRMRLPRFEDNRHMKVVRLSDLRTVRLYLQEIFLILISVKRLSQPEDHSAAGKIMSMKNSNDTIGNRTRDLQSCSAVPQPTAPPGAPNKFYVKLKTY